MADFGKNANRYPAPLKVRNWAQIPDRCCASRRRNFERLPSDQVSLEWRPNSMSQGRFMGEQSKQRKIATDLAADAALCRRRIEADIAAAAPAPGLRYQAGR
jgi:hypothetical protein